ncbi:MAG TPA: hypothetical protein VN772_05565 [Solirubrobacteraceae bacterium]|nr:hypothetical protein [Solirubrobacteraceae bacterium]
MPPVERFLPRFAAEPPQEELPYGRWEEHLRREFLDAASRIDAPEEELGEPGPLTWYPERSWHGRTYVPATSRTSGGYELFGYVRFVPGEEGGEPSEFSPYVDFTEELAERNPDWRLDLCEEVIGAWRGHFGAVAAMTLVWGRPLVPGGRIATAELADLAVDQCELVQERFTLIAPDDYRGDLLEIKLFDVKGRELARESLYAGEDEPAQDDEDSDTAGA